MTAKPTTQDRKESREQERCCINLVRTVRFASGRLSRPANSTAASLRPANQREQPSPAVPASKLNSPCALIRKQIWRPDENPTGKVVASEEGHACGFPSLVQDRLDEIDFIQMWARIKECSGARATDELFLLRRL